MDSLLLRSTLAADCLLPRPTLAVARREMGAVEMAQIQCLPNQQLLDRCSQVKALSSFMHRNENRDRERIHWTGTQSFITPLFYS